MFIVHTYYNTTTLILTHTPGRLSACAPVRTAHSAQALSVFVGKWTILERGNDTWSLEDQHLVDKKETNLEQDMGRKENGVELLTKKRKRGKRHEGGEMMSNGGMGLTNNEAKKTLAVEAHHDSSDHEEEITAKVAMRKMGPSSSNHAEEYYYGDEDTNRKEMEESSIQLLRPSHRYPARGPMTVFK